MQYKGTYRRGSNITGKAARNRVKRISLSLLFIIVFIITFFLSTLKILNKFENNISMSKEEIKSYIDITDELSKVGYQLNWQEVASINSALNNGSFEINNENINNIANYSRLYGSIGAVFVLMTWLYITSIILIIGAEFNSVLHVTRE